MSSPQSNRHILPTHTAFLTSLITSLATLSRQQPLLLNNNAPTPSLHPPTSATFPNAARNLFLTLHVLFPHILLDALDLLDRGLITRFTIQDVDHAPPPPTNIVAHSSTVDTPAAPKPTTPSPADPPKLPVSEVSNPTPQKTRTAYYVRPTHSALQRAPQAQHNRRTRSGNTSIAGGRRGGGAAGGGGGGGGGGGHQVHLSAWNCSCPAFAYAAFSNAAAVEDEAAVVEDGADAVEGTGEVADQVAVRMEGFRFGGLARVQRREGRGGGVPPVCKHLLACVLAEECAGFFGVRVEAGVGDLGEEGRGVLRRMVSEMEFAGWAAGGGFG